MYIGLESMGIYRLSGTSSRVQALKRALDTDFENTDVMSEDGLRILMLFLVL